MIIDSVNWIKEPVLTPLQSKAWKLLTKAMSGASSQFDHWDQVPLETQQAYIYKAMNIPKIK